MMQEHFKDALDIYVAQTGTINTLWNIFLAVSVAMLGYVYKDRTLMDDWKIKLGLSLGFPLFVTANDFAMTRSQAIVVAAAEYFKNVPTTGEPSFDAVLKAHQTTISVAEMHVAHVSFALLVLMAMWLPNITTAFRSRKTKSRKAA